MTDIPRYTKWEQVPAGLHTRTQLGRMDPPRRLKPGAVPRGRALYHGNKYADLYDLDDSEPKAAPSAKQVASARRAGELRYVCRWCAHVDDDILPRRICPDCCDVLRAYGRHLEGRATLGGLHEVVPWRPLYAAVERGDNPYWPTWITVVDPEQGGRLRPALGAVVADTALPKVGPDDSGLTSAADLDAWRAAVAALPGDARPIIIWPAVGSGRLRSASWDWRRWLGTLDNVTGDYDRPPGATGDLADDARLLADLVAGIVSGRVEPPAPCWVDRGITPEQMRPFVGTYTTRRVVEFVDRLAELPDAPRRTT